MTRRTASLTLCALALALVPSAAFAEAEGATIDKTGWWNRVNTATPTPAGPVTIPPPPGIPEDDIAVGFAGAEPSAVAAIGIQPDDGDGATVQGFTLSITEDPDANGNAGTETASIVACPITDFWAGGGNGDWDTRPNADCKAASVAGVRDDEGVWKFDLTPIARVWFDPFGTITADGVLLQPGPDQASPFQAVFLAGDDIDVDLDTTAAPDDGGGAFEFEDPPSDAGLNSGPSGGGSSIFSPPSISDPPSFDSGSDLPTTPVETPAPAAEEPADETAAPPVADSPDTEAVASRAGDLAGNLSPLVLFGILFIGAFLVVTSYWLGPAGQPVTTVRQRGVSRALAARARANKGS